MTFKLPQLAFKDGIKGFISAETLSYHHGKHHQTYITKLNENLEKSEGKDWKGKSLVQIIKGCKTPSIFNNAAQHWNHSFYWHCLSTQADQKPDGQLKSAINSKWGSTQKFIEEFSARSAANFGSGWTWLVRDKDHSLSIVDTSNAGNPLTDGTHPILTVDVWQHAYYIDYRNARPKYLTDFSKFINWKYVGHNFHGEKIQLDV